MGYLDEVEKKRQAATSKQSQDSDKQESISAIESGSKSVVSEIARQGEKSRTNTQKVEVENADLAKSTDVNAVVDSINKLNMTTFMASKENWVNVVNDMSDLSERMQGVVSDLNKNGVNRLEKGLDATVNKLQSVVDSMKSISIKSDEDVIKGLRELSKSIDNIKVSPTVNVPAPHVTVDSKETDLSPLATLLEDIKSQLKNNKVNIPKTDFSPLEDAVRSVKTSIESLSFPVPNYILPYKDPTTGKATQVTLTTDGKIPVDATVSLDPTGLATDTNQTNGTQKTQIVDAGGEAVTVTGGKLDVNASVDTTGLATSAKQDTGNTSLASIDGKITAVNTGAVVVSSSALPTGAATAAKQPALGTAGSASTDVITVQGIASGTAQPISAASLPLPSGAATSALQTQPGVDIGDVTINNASGASAVNIQDGGNSITVDAPVGTPAFVRLSDGSAAISTLPVSLASVPSHAVTNAGTFATQVDGSALTALQLIDDPVFADDAAYTLSTSKANVVGGIAVETDGTDPGTVSAEADVSALRTDRQRTLLVNPTPPRNWSVSADYASAQTNTSVKATPGSGLKLYITDISISNGATAGNITLLNGSGGTVLYEIYPAINGGAVDNRRSPIVLSADTALCITSTTVTTHSVNISGYIAP